MYMYFLKSYQVHVFRSLGIIFPEKNYHLPTHQTLITSLLIFFNLSGGTSVIEFYLFSLTYPYNDMENVVIFQNFFL